MRELATTAALAGMILALAACGQRASETAKSDAPAGAAANSPGPMSGMPTPKPGLWQYAVSSPDSPEQTMTMCLDAATAAKAIAGSPTPASACSENSYNRGVDGTIAFKTVCDLGTGGVQQNEGKISGDFNSAYTMTYHNVTTGAALSQMNQSTDVSVKANWSGPCPEGMKPGDMQIGGMTLNLSQGAPAK